MPDRSAGGFGGRGRHREAVDRAGVGGTSSIAGFTSADWAPQRIVSSPPSLEAGDDVEVRLHLLDPQDPQELPNAFRGSVEGERAERALLRRLFSAWPAKHQLLRLLRPIGRGRE